MCLNDLFTDIADAIRTKKGTTDKIIASNFPEEIASIQGGGSVEVEGIRLFSTIEEMNNDTTAKETDLAVVYRADTTYRRVEVGDKIQPVCFINQITFPKKITENTTYNISTKINTNAFFSTNGTGVITVTPTTANVSFSMQNGSVGLVDLKYTSVDGITYTNDLRGELYEVKIDLGIYGENWLGTVESFDGYANYFFAVDVTQKNVFEGLYEYVNSGWESARTQLDASSEHIIEGKTAYSDGIIEGSLKDNGTLNYVPSNEEQTIPEGYTSGGIVQGDNNLVAENIRAGVSVFGVTGTHEGMTLQINSIEGVSVEGTTLVMEVNNG